MSQLGQNIIALNPDIMGTQETQDAKLLERYTNGLLKYLPNTRGNPIYYNPDKMSWEGVSGSFRIPRDNYAERSVTFGKFKLGGVAFWLFNTHLPHKHNEAGRRNTHANIAQTLLDERKKLGADNEPTVVTGDFNPFASNGDSQGSFESNLVSDGFTKSYQAVHWGLDKIFHSTEHWTSANGADGPFGGSDHTPIHVELTML
jgi:endonuclease/exonuclease/phosphatase family metal-dependent hydrolase